jgi:hypothetical protein
MAMAKALEKARLAEASIASAAASIAAIARGRPPSPPSSRGGFPSRSFSGRFWGRGRRRSERPRSLAGSLSPPGPGPGLTCPSGGERGGRRNRKLGSRGKFVCAGDEPMTDDERVGVGMVDLGWLGGLCD